LVQSVIRETGALIIAKYGFTAIEQENYIQKTIKRFKNPYIVDEVTRVARSPLRKLSANDRFIKPMVELSDRGLATDALQRSVANVLHYDFAKDEEAIRLQKDIQEKGVARALADATGLSSDNRIVRQIVALY
jgi:mannitol-1-phosphate 5-dehydrogenase